MNQATFSVDEVLLDRTERFPVEPGMNLDATIRDCLAGPKAVKSEEAHSARMSLIQLARNSHREMVSEWNRLPSSKSILIGPNRPGGVTPDACKIDDMPGHFHKRGSVGVAFRSGTLTYWVVGQTTAAGLGQSTCVGIGGAEEDKAQFLEDEAKRGRARPIAERFASKGRRMGHTGAIVTGGAKEKIEAMGSAGFVVADSPAGLEMAVLKAIRRG